MTAEAIALLSQFLTVTQAAAKRGVRAECVHQALRRGTLPGYKLGPRVWLIHQDDLAAWDEHARQHPKGGAPSHRK